MIYILGGGGVFHIQKIQIWFIFVTILFEKEKKEKNLNLIIFPPIRT